MHRPPPPELDEFLAPFPDAVVEIALRLRARVLEAMPNAHEVVWDATNTVSDVFSPTTRWQDGVCHVATYSKHVNLGFNDGASLPDPDGILEGTGTRIRHVPVRSLHDAAEPWVDRYLAAALHHLGLTADDGVGGTTIRSSAGPKRRPGI